MATVISIVSYPFLPAKTGGEKFVAYFSKYFSNYHQLTCITTKKNNPEFADGYEVLNIISNSKWRYINIFYFFTIRKIIKQKKATHLLIVQPYYGWLAVLLKWFCNVKLIVLSHNIEGLRWKTLGKWWWRMLSQYEKFTHRQIDYNFFVQDEDKKYAIEKFGLDPSKCIKVTYGIDWNKIPDLQELQKAKQQIRTAHNISPEKKILFFNGAFNYKPNLDALKRIIDIINPLLQQEINFNYCLIICGMKIPAEIISSQFPGIIIAGFVDDVSVYFKGAEVFLNPITEGGGIKTKLVEALGYNLNAVSTQHGAIGINPDWCNNKLQICENSDWKFFVELTVKLSTYIADIPEIYFEHFYWRDITKKAAEFIE
ncbi:MAG TPA: glycosyltransferase [Puia sp.]|jgi:glycosyltransferase involved in cell wall biosynthesis